MKRLKKKTLAAAALVVAGAVYYFTGGNDSADAPEPQQEPSEVSRATGKSSSGKRSSTVAAGLEIPASTGSGRIVRHGAYVTSYNTSTLIPDWVAYELTAEEAGGRRDREGIEFRMDPDLKGCTQAMREDYSGSGWTKGHLIPAADAATSSSTMAETFYFTNICPQDETLNAGDWQYLEKKVRSWARRYGSVFVVTGPIVGENRYGTIGDRDVTVPDAFYKALLVRRKDGSYSSIAFVMGNDSERYFLKDCNITVDELERLTGFDFFPGLDDRIEEKVESKVRLSDWGI
ncbi:MAG: DNA/RNA non-specific endonuclease [Bacteroidales bacterium]|nr:DNA/RNA non-specific endonuclease [Bacteroidales bacterium]